MKKITPALNRTEIQTRSVFGSHRCTAINSFVPRVLRFLVGNDWLVFAMNDRTPVAGTRGASRREDYFRVFCPAGALLLAFARLPELLFFAEIFVGR